MLLYFGGIFYGIPKYPVIDGPPARALQGLVNRSFCGYSACTYLKKHLKKFSWPMVV